MIDRRRSPWSRADLVIFFVFAGLTVVSVRWADSEWFASEANSRQPAFRAVARPEWAWEMQKPFQRIMHDYFWICPPITLGLLALVIRDPSSFGRRGMARPGTRGVLMITMVGGVACIHHRLIRPAFFSGNLPLSFQFLNVLEYWILGLVIGSWIVTRLGRRSRRPPGWRERLARGVGWAWMANVALSIAYEIIFG